MVAFIFRTETTCKKEPKQIFVPSWIQIKHGDCQGMYNQHKKICLKILNTMLVAGTYSTLWLYINIIVITDRVCFAY